MPFPIDLVQAFEVIEPLSYYVFGISAYALFIFSFYKFIAKRDIFSLNLQQYSTASNLEWRKFYQVLLYILEYMVIFPVFTFFWFLVLVVLLVFLSKSQPIESILLISIAMVSVVRITSYFKEELAVDLAKLLPLTLLAVFLIEGASFAPLQSIATILQIPTHMTTIVHYLMFAVLVEFVMRVISLTVGSLILKDAK